MLPVQFLDLIFELIDMRSFSNLWYWIVLAVFWSVSSHFVFGVPNDMVQRAQRDGGQVAEDVVDLARINITRMVDIVDQGGIALAGLATFLMTTLFLLAVFYGVEFAQALLFILGPFLFISWLTYRRAMRIISENPDFDALVQHIKSHRRHIQIFGVACIFVTSMWGMWVNLNGPTWY